LILKVLSNDSKVTDTHGKVVMNTGYTEVIIVHMPTACGRGGGSVVGICGLMRTQHFGICTPLESTPSGVCRNIASD